MGNFMHADLRRIARATVAGLAAGVVMLASGGAAGAQPPGDQCSPAAMMRAHAAAMSQMADYLDAHPDVQQAVTNARSMPTAEERQAAMNAYNAAHPDVASAFQNMHQSVANLTTSCGLSMDQTMMVPGGMMMTGMMGSPGNQMAPGDQMMPDGIMSGQ